MTAWVTPAQHQPVLMQTVQGGASLTVPMSYEEYEALGEAKHTACYDEPARRARR